MYTIYVNIYTKIYKEIIFLYHVWCSTLLTTYSYSWIQMRKTLRPSKILCHTPNFNPGQIWAVHMHLAGLLEDVNSACAMPFSSISESVPPGSGWMRWNAHREILAKWKHPTDSSEALGNGITHSNLTNGHDMTYMTCSFQNFHWPCAESWRVNHEIENVKAKITKSR